MFQHENEGPGLDQTRGEHDTILATNWVDYADQFFFSILSHSWPSREISNKSELLVCGQIAGLHREVGSSLVSGVRWAAVAS